MPTETSLPLRRLSLLIASLLATWAPASHAQTDDTTPFYVGGSLGLTHVANVYRTNNAPNSDTVTTAALLGGIDQRLGRQHVTLDGSLQDNRYSTNTDLNYRAYNVRGALDWQTVGNLSGVLSAKSDRTMAEFNISSIAQAIQKKNIVTNDEYQALARLGVATRYTLEAGWTHQNRDYTAWQYEQLVFSQNTAQLGVYATPAGNVRLGLVGRHSTGSNPRYPDGQGLQLINGEIRPTTSPNDYTRDDLDFTTRWSVGGHSTVNTRISRSRKRNSLDLLRDFTSTTGSIGWDWRPTAKLQVNAQYARDTGQETMVQSSELNRVYTTWQLSTAYALTGKLSLNAKASNNRATRSRDAGNAPSDALDDTRSYTLGLRWAFSRGLSVSCQYDHINRDNSQPAYVYTASSYGCTGQAIFF